MPQTGSRLHSHTPLIAVLLLGTALVGCNQGQVPVAQPSDSGSAAADAAPATLPLTTTGPATLVAAPPATALPAGQPMPLRRLANRRQGYGYLDRANYQEEAFADAPPDYSFDQDGVRPWTWASRDGARVITEPVAGGYRSYYYDAGAQEPYLVREPRYSYAYENGALVGVFGQDGRMYDPQAGNEQALAAARYHQRARSLWRNAQDGQRVPVNAHAWGDRRADLSSQRMNWQSHVADNPDWSSWHNDHGAQERGRWDDVRNEHQQAAQQFDSWQQQQYQGPPPQFYDDGSQRSDNRRSNHTAAAVVGGVAVGAIAATLARSLFGRGHDQNQAPQQAAAPPVVRQPAMVPATVVPTYGPGAPARPVPVVVPQMVAPRPAPPPVGPRAAPQMAAPRPAAPPVAARVAPAPAAPRAAPQMIAPRPAPPSVAARAAPPPVAPRPAVPPVAARVAPAPVAPRAAPQIAVPRPAPSSVAAHPAPLAAPALVVPPRTPAQPVAARIVLQPNAARPVPQVIAPRIVPVPVVSRVLPPPVAVHVVRPVIAAHPAPPPVAPPPVPKPAAVKKPVPPADGQPGHAHERQGPN